MALQKIAYGQNNWDKIINGNFDATETQFDKITNGTDWQPVSLIAPVTGTLQFKIQNRVLYFVGSFKANTTGVEVKIGMLPQQIHDKSFVGKNKSTGETVGVRIGNTGNLMAHITSAKNSISLDGVAVLVGDISLGGGRKPRLNHWFKGIYSHLELEVA
ncbi:hypothetical protein [Loigolactobacillus rennini]|uniref:Uncharacterized protein n=1 Tax=Loigolactobacillus rennini DSM 20253 TaxID=1423796 RepID=A0A0R2CYL4_9LACO|nr:hypothetical protein [Loigolactobacillus rennini]KRM92870.1 hypothetical protein FC24_GL000886 [Loigolactobacillus rennini DSM 20253]